MKRRPEKPLSYVEREVFKLRYGLGTDGYTYTLEEVGHIFKLTRERIRQVERNAIRKLANMGLRIEDPTLARPTKKRTT